MTITEALKIINVNGCNTPENVNQEAHEVINHEMKYRIAVKPEIIRGTSLFGEAACPECGSVVYRIEHYCHNCGQAIDWNEVEE